MKRKAKYIMDKSKILPSADRTFCCIVSLLVCCCVASTFPLIYCCVASPIDCHIVDRQSETNIAGPPLTIQFSLLGQYWRPRNSAGCRPIRVSIGRRFQCCLCPSATTNMLELRVQMVFQNVAEKCYSGRMREMNA